MAGETAAERWERRMEYLPSVRYCRAPYSAKWCCGDTVIYIPPPRRYGAMLELRRRFNATYGENGGLISTVASACVSKVSNSLLL